MKNLVAAAMLLGVLAALAAVLVLVGCVSGGPSQPGAYINKNWGHSLPEVAMLVKEGSGGGNYDFDLTWNSNKSAAYHVPSGTFDLYVYPAATLDEIFGKRGLRICPLDVEGARWTSLVYISDADLGSSKQDPKPTAKFTVTLPQRGRYFIGVEDVGAPASVWLVWW
jgi:hypothetical protein